jgi:hypothetical protein
LKHLPKASVIGLKTGPTSNSTKQSGPVFYLLSCELDKEAFIAQIVLKEQMKQGPIALLSCVEPCLSFRVRRDHQTKKVRLVMESLRCTHLYHYYEHPKVGRMHVRVQTWFPFSVEYASTVTNGWRVRWIGLALVINSGITASSGLKIMRRLKSSWMNSYVTIGRP